VGTVRVTCHGVFGDVNNVIQIRYNWAWVPGVSHCCPTERSQFGQTHRLISPVPVRNTHIAGCPLSSLDQLDAPFLTDCHRSHGHLTHRYLLISTGPLPLVNAIYVSHTSRSSHIVKPAVVCWSPNPESRYIIHHICQVQTVHSVQYTTPLESQTELLLFPIIFGVLSAEPGTSPSAPPK